METSLPGWSRGVWGRTRVPLPTLPAARSCRGPEPPPGQRCRPIHSSMPFRAHAALTAKLSPGAGTTPAPECGCQAESYRREEGKRGRGGREGVESRGTIRERRRPWGEGDAAKPQEQGRRGEREGGAVPKEEGPGDRKSEPQGPGLPSKGARV